MPAADIPGARFAIRREMQTTPLQLPAFSEAGAVHMVVESPRCSKAKFKYDAKLGCFRMDRTLSLGLSYPYDWGFVPSTLMEDGDPLDALLVADFASFPGVIVECEPLGIIQVTQPGIEEKAGQRVHNDRVVLVPVHAPRERALWTKNEVPARVRAELEVFFLTTVLLDKEGVRILGWQNSDAARDLIKHSLSQ